MGFSHCSHSPLPQRVSPAPDGNLASRSSSQGSHAAGPTRLTHVPSRRISIKTVWPPISGDSRSRWCSITLTMVLGLTNRATVHWCSSALHAVPTEANIHYRRRITMKSAKCHDQAFVRASEFPTQTSFRALRYLADLVRPPADREKAPRSGSFVLHSRNDQS